MIRYNQLWSDLYRIWLRNKMKNLLLYIAFIFALSSVFGQSTDQKLALYYYNHGECEKAIPYFEKTYPNHPTPYIYERYLSCLRSEKQNKEVIKLIEQQVRNYPYKINYQVELGHEYEQQGDERKATNIYEKLIEDLEGNPSKIIELQQAFSKLGKNKLALKTLQQGDQLLNGRYPFNMQLAQVYSDLNQTDKMIEEYIDLLDYNPRMLPSLKQALPRVIDFQNTQNNKRFESFRTILIRRIQKDPTNDTYSKLLIWSLIQRRNYNAALIQAKSLSRRTGDQGESVFQIGNQATQNKDFEIAHQAFQYVMGLGSDKIYYFSAQQRLLNVSYQEIISQRNYTPSQINLTIQTFQKALQTLPKTGRSLPIIRELAEIQAYYGNQPQKSIDLLKKALQYPQSTALDLAKVKMLLADIKVLQNDIWNASLLYLQIDNQFKYEPIGEEARFKNARIYYYTGDFKYAQSQLNVLKQATTKLIANDALNLSAFITENLGLDSNLTAMKKFAKADLLLQQHLYEIAFHLYDSIQKFYPNHKLGDDILMRKAKAYKAQGKWEQAVDKLQSIVKNFSQEILADDALFQLANLYKNQLHQPKKAKAMYLQLMKKYKGSIFVTEARSSYRAIQ